MNAEQQVAVVTGANSGVGLAIARQLLLLSPHSPTLVLACRNEKRGARARAQLLQDFPSADIRLIELDTSNVLSVQTAAREITSLGRLDLLFCNAGAMAIKSLNILGIIRGLTHPIAFFESSEALVQQQGLVTPDGLGQTFQTNVFGHYLLVHKLLPVLSRAKGRVIWTGSSASQLEFSQLDYMHIHGLKPYESSKYIVDQISQKMDERLRQKGVRCFVGEPGNVCTSFLANIGVPVLQMLIVVVFYLMRICGLQRFTIDAQCASAAFIYLAFARDEEVDASQKYYSCASRWGHSSVVRAPLECCTKDADFLISKLDALVDRFDQ
ncbi:hypothetical protein IW139_000617 [Coemansia sp. RSA 353]|nr:hypothetical protein GGH17_000538 [Coemansia sp. RSA 788]KAJ2144563.1 hypothetical protein IW142_003077 [Coemansia sp. RSA 564]KAJ2168463.1 hypothetical protein GGH15_001360 [Coemansia sp. RSA 562]KAJ2190874.1 hypothetical protein EV181_000718 [Coemansia sp. RSA 532]KAJ2199385.1 hypothetical protein GGH18_000555 [Coemansia sp. RSA 530]KAJ2200686.1 hypothetical protein IW144_000917 [Coemansia sp. RSA 522]KAJ2208668.1 hypothetical protein IW145_000561 [Coemansia sp. RSA 521]KAJ2225005.1 hyp